MCSLRVLKREDLEFLGLIRHGGQASVYLARLLNQDAGKAIAVKLYHADFASLLCYQNELQIIAHAEHPSIVKPIGRFEHGDHRGLVLELLTGITLAEAIVALAKHGGQLAVMTANYIAARTLSAIAHLHRGLKGSQAFPSGIVHADLSSDNIFLSDAGEISLIDFGASVTGFGGPTNYCAFGKRKYLAPEQLAGHHPSFWSDLYALGAVLFEALMLQPLAKSRLAAELLALHSLFRPSEENLFLIIKACLAPSPFFRPKSAALAYDLLPPMTDAQVLNAKDDLRRLIEQSKKR